MRLVLVLSDFAEGTDVLSIGAGLGGLLAPLVTRADGAAMLRCSLSAAVVGAGLSVVARLALRVVVAVRVARSAIVIRGLPARQEQAQAQQDVAEQLGRP